MSIYNSSNKKFKVDINGNLIPTTKSIYEPTFQLPKSETDLMLEDLDLAKLENIGFDPKTIITGKTLDQRIGADAVKQAKDASKVVKPPLDPPPVDGKGLSTIGAANIATGITTAANVATSIYGAIQASKMQPALMKYQAPTEAVLVKDNSSAIETAGKENIDKSINTARSLNQRNGLVGMDGVYIAKENEALNQLGSQLAQYRTGIDSQNAQIENAVNAQNKQTAMQVDQFNASTLNQSDRDKSIMMGTAWKNATDSLASGAESIFGNMMAGAQMNLTSINNEIGTIMEQMKDPNFITTNPRQKEIRDRLEELQKQKNKVNESLFTQPTLKA